MSTWKVLEEFQEEGRARSIGVSNFQVPHLERLAAETGTVPAVNQVEHHPYFANAEVTAYGRDHGIVTEAWSPLAQGKVPKEPVAIEIGERLGKTASQVVLRWHLQHGHVVFPKSTTPSRIEENFGLFDFELSSDDIARLDAPIRVPPAASARTPTPSRSSPRRRHAPTSPCAEAPGSPPVRASAQPRT